MSKALPQALRTRVPADIAPAEMRTALAGKGVGMATLLHAKRAPDRLRLIEKPTSLLRKAVERTVDRLRDAIGHMIDEFPPCEWEDVLDIAGYEAR